MKPPLIALIVLAAVAVVPLPASANQPGPGWVVTCPYTHSLSDDPIVNPGHPGGSHLHDFFGNRSTSANSTLSSMKAASTRCKVAADTAGYWAPALYKNDTQIKPIRPGHFDPRTTIYYINNLSGYPSSDIHNLPAGLKIVAGNATAKSIATNPELGKEIYWGCSDNTPDKKFKAPVDCASKIITLHIGFPNCWDGVHLDTSDHQSHMSYPIHTTAGYICPSSHPVPIPRVVMRIEYQVGTHSSGITLSSGATYTAHGDFWNTWHQHKLNKLTSQCIRARVRCGTDP
jgi:Domain of unknown function (DUF1996)